MNKLRRFRFLNMLYAHINAYFWLPCPVCGENFGGHETGDASLMTSWAGGKTVCYKEVCNNYALQHNESYMKDNPHPAICGGKR